MRQSRSALLCSSTFLAPTFSALTLGIVLLCTVLVSSRTFAAEPDRITGPIDASQTVSAGGVPMKAQPKYDRGRAEPSLKLNHMTLLTVPSASQQQAMEELLTEQQDPRSPLFHQWLTPAQYADRFGLSPNDIQKLTAWLQSQGFSVQSIAQGRNWIVFSGTAAQAEKVFHVELHNFEIDGRKRFSNSSPISIPAALSGIVTGVRGLSNFPAKSYLQRRKPGYTYSVSAGNNALYIAPGDIATIYDLTPLYNAGIDGTGMTLAVMGQTDVYLDDLVDFRSPTIGFNLPALTGCSTNSSGVITSCTSGSTNLLQYVLVGSDTTGEPDSISDDLPEADLDLEMSGAVARNAQIIYVNAPDPSGNGVWDSWYYAVDNKLAPVITLSYGICEFSEAVNNGDTGEGTFTSDEAELRKANSYGITFMNSSGDSGAAECDPPEDAQNELFASQGLAVSYPASSPEVTGVGGTMTTISETGADAATYWYTGNDTNSNSNGGSAIGYIPEAAWNDAAEIGAYCAVPPTGSNCVADGISNQETAQEFIGFNASGGGPSGCTVLTVTNGVSNCTSGFAQPSWQTVTVPSQASARFVPDVSLLASPNLPGFIWCTAVDELADPGVSPYDTETTSSCASGINAAIAGVPNPNTNDQAYVGASIIGGTSASSPMFAGIVTLLNQYLVTNKVQSTPGVGNINPKLYELAISHPAAFHRITASDFAAAPGSNTEYCDPGTPVFTTAPATKLNCPAAVSPATEGVFGYLSANADTTTGYNLVTGLGSVDGYNLVLAFAALGSNTSTTVTSSQDPAVQGATVTLTATVTTTGADQPTGTVTFNNGTTALGTGTLSTVSGSQVATFATSTLPLGANSITAVYGGDANNTGGASPILTQYITGATTSHTTLVSSQNPAPLLGSVTFTATVTTTGAHAPTGIVTFNDGGTAIGTGTISTVSGSQVATFSTSSLAVGANSITAVYDGDANNASSTSALTETITNFTVSTPTTPSPVLAGLSASSTFTVTPPSGASTFTANVVLSVSGLPVNTTYSFSTNPIPAGSGPTNETLTITTAGPNTTPGGQLRRRADKKSPGFPLALPLAGIVMVGFAGRKMSKHSAAAGLCVSLLLLALLIACGGGSSSTPPPAAVTVAPSAASVPLGATQQFTASTTVTWSIPSTALGTISSSGLYTAPTSGTTPANITVTATPTTGTAGTAAITIPAVGVAVSGSPTSVYPNDTADNWPSQTAQFTATVTNASSNTGVTWAVTTANGGTINASGLYTAPNVAAGLPASVTITATPTADPTKSGSAPETITPATIPGTYPGITVSATEGGTVNTQTVTLTVN
jgi:Pro-kumamolisin, activation domain/Bacterial Ig-like domain (group 3)